jgi:hypothetical protein
MVPEARKGARIIPAGAIFTDKISYNHLLYVIFLKNFAVQTFFLRNQTKIDDPPDHVLG